MKISRQHVHADTSGLPCLQFEQQNLTSYGGLVLIQQLLAVLGLNARIARCFRHRKRDKAYGFARVFRLLIVHIMPGFRDLSDVAFYQQGPLVRHVLGQREFSCGATISRYLKQADVKSLGLTEQMLMQLVIDRLVEAGLNRITIDYDGMVQSTKRHAEGTAVGYNSRRKGARSYYPLYATIAQTGQVLGVLHRSGNVHDSHGARAFILGCVRRVRAAMPRAIIEVRMDSAFFSDQIVRALDEEGVEFSISVPFERFATLKQTIEDRCTWYELNDERWAFEKQWKPKSWKRRCRFVFVCTQRAVQRKGPIQLHLFQPRDRCFDYKVVVTNRDVGVDHIVAFHDGRGAQENIFGRLRSQCQAGHVPVMGLNGNRLYLLASLMAHNLLHELQMQVKPRCKGTTPSPPALWEFEQPQTFRARWLARAGRLTRPADRLTLPIALVGRAATRFLEMFKALGSRRQAA